jgi:hypothetical protein
MAASGGGPISMNTALIQDEDLSFVTARPCSLIERRWPVPTRRQHDDRGSMRDRYKDAPLCGVVVIEFVG